MEIFGQLEIVEERYEKLNELLSDPDVVSDTKKLMEYSKEQRSIEKTVAVFREYKDIVQQIKDTKELLEIEEDKEMKEMMQEEIKELEPTLAPMEEKSYYYQKILTMGKMLLLRFVEQLVEMKRNYLLVIYYVCTLDLLNLKDGKLTS